QALNLLPASDPVRPPLLKQLERCDCLLTLELKLPDVLAGKTKPADNRERLDLGRICEHQQRYAARAKLFSDPFAIDPKLADDVKAGHRHDAACAAALAGCGEGKDADVLDAEERARLRGQALDWLRADLAAWDKLLEKDADKVGHVVEKKM